MKLYSTKQVAKKLGLRTDYNELFQLIYDRWRDNKKAPHHIIKPTVMNGPRQGSYFNEDRVKEIRLLKELRDFGVKFSARKKILDMYKKTKSTKLQISEYFEIRLKL